MPFIVVIAAETGYTGGRGYTGEITCHNSLTGAPFRDELPRYTNILTFTITCRHLTRRCTLTSNHGIAQALSLQVIS